MGLFTFADLGNPFDDYIGFDSTHRMGILYNGKNEDGHGGPGEYGPNPPMMGIAIVELPGDAAASYVPAGSFGYGSAPLIPQQYYRYLNITYPGSTYGFKENSECVNENVASDRNFIIASNSLTFSPGDTKKIGMALVVCANAGGCPNMNFSCIHNVADTDWYLYHNPPSGANQLGVNTLSKGALRIYPNPATSTLHVETPGGTPGILSIYDAVGRSISLPVIHQGTKTDVNTSTLPNGVYTIRYQSGAQVQTNIFVKE